MKALRRFTVRTHLPERWRRWNDCRSTSGGRGDKPTRDLFAVIERRAVAADQTATRWPCWERSVRKRLDELAADESFLGHLDGLAADLDTYLSRPLWYQQQIADGVEMPKGIAYFSMEFGVAEVLPNYSGGLGILAGDHLKSASGSRPAPDRGGPVLPLGIFPAVPDRRRLAA